MAFPVDCSFLPAFLSIPRSFRRGGRGLLLLLLATGLRAQQIQKGQELFFSGKYEQAREALQAGRASVERVYWLSLVLEEQGKYAAAQQAIEEFRGYEHAPLLLTRLGELEFLTGRYEDAENHFRRAFLQDSTMLEARLNWGHFLSWRGERRRAKRILQTFVDLYRATDRPDARLNYLTARACIDLGRFQDASDLFDEASQQSPTDWRIRVAWGNLFIEKYNYGDAAAVFKEALEGNPECVPASLGLARAKEPTENHVALKIVEELLKKHGDRIDVANYAAHLYLLVGKNDRAGEQIEKILKRYPEHLPTLTLAGALALQQKDRARFDRIAAQVQRIHPRYSRFFTEAGDALARRYLFSEAVEMYRRALRIDPEDAAAHAGLGTTLSRLARLAEARKELEKAFALDAYNVWTGNLLNLFDSYSEYDTLRTKHFLIRLHKSDAPILGPYVRELAEKAYAALVPRYGLQIDFPVTVEIFPQHDDFAVRCFGLPGAQVFLGICFGPLITMNSPRARPVGTFNWQETLWHEFAHVVHLTLTRNRVPRWLAEGISVYEATRANRAWDMNLQVPLMQALQEEKLIPLSELDSGFTGDPRRVTFSYYQSAQMVRFIVDTFGFEKLRALLQAFGHDLDTRAAVKTVLHLDLDDFDAQFAEYLRGVYPVKKVTFDPHLAKLIEQDRPSERLLKDLISKNPKLYFVKLKYAKYLLEKEEVDEALPILQEAQKAFPDFVGEANSYELMARAFLLKGDTLAAAQQLAGLVSRDGKNYHAAMQLKKLAQGLGERRLLQQALEAIVQINPYLQEVHQKLGRIYLQERKPQQAVREFEVLLALKPLDRAGAHCDLAEAYLAAGRPRLAHRHALRALEVAPTYSRAQQLLLQTATRQ